MPYKKITIKQIAALAGVSLGTVDRVIHRRGRVSHANQERIEAILKEHNYCPNILARSLSSKKQYNLLCLLPKSERGDYWETVVWGIQKAQQEFADFHVKIEYIFFAHEPTAFENAVSEALKKNPDGVLLVPLFRKESIILVTHLKERKTPCVFIDSNIESIDGVSYFGHHAIQSGVVAANILASQVPKDSTILACKFIKSDVVESNQTDGRMLGFTTYFESFYPGHKIVPVEFFLTKPTLYSKVLDKVFKDHSNITGMITFSSKAFILADYIQKRQLNNITLLGYDLLEQNVTHLKNGNIFSLIAQHPQQQGYFGIKELVNNLLTNVPLQRQHYMPIDILNKYNIDYYHQY